MGRLVGQVHPAVLIGVLINVGQRLRTEHNSDEQERVGHFPKLK